MIEKICKFINAIIIVILLIVAMLTLGPKLFGNQTLAVLSGSMEPNIHVGSLVIVQDVDFNDLEVDDVITYRLSEDTMVTHRIIEIDEEKQEVITKGDANDVADGTPVTANNIVGKVKYTIPFLGYVVLNIKTPLGIVGICAVVFVILLVNFIPEIIEENKKNKKNQE